MYVPENAFRKAPSPKMSLLSWTRSDVRLVLAADECDIVSVAVYYIMCMYSLCINERERGGNNQ